MEQQQNTHDSGVTVVSQRRRQRTIQFIIAVAVFILGMAGGLAAQPTVSGRVTAVIFFGLLIGLVTLLWLLLNRRRDRVEVTRDAISRRRWGGAVDVTLSRKQGDDLRLIPRLRDHGFTATDRLTIVGSGDAISLFGFAPHAVTRACRARGWRFGDGTSEQGARDLRRLLEAGMLAEAAQLVDLFGPYDVNVDPDSTVSLGAAVLEAYADELASTDRNAARAAYQRAANAQRSYAAFTTTSGGDGTARMTEAQRLDAKGSA
jgi:hypothetical protein